MFGDRSYCAWLVLLLVVSGCGPSDKAPKTTAAPVAYDPLDPTQTAGGKGAKPTPPSLGPSVIAQPVAVADKAGNPTGIVLNLPKGFDSIEAIDQIPYHVLAPDAQAISYRMWVKDSTGAKTTPIYCCFAVFPATASREQIKEKIRRRNQNAVVDGRPVLQPADLNFIEGDFDTPTGWMRIGPIDGAVYQYVLQDGSRAKNLQRDLKVFYRATTEKQVIVIWDIPIDIDFSYSYFPKASLTSLTSLKIDSENPGYETSTPPAVVSNGPKELPNDPALAEMLAPVSASAPGQSNDPLAQPAVSPNQTPSAGSTGQPTPSEPTTLLAAAQKAFAEGRDVDAKKLLYAAAITGEEPEKLIGSMLWVTGIKRPAMMVRTGVGIQLARPNRYGGPPAPLGRTSEGTGLDTSQSNQQERNAAPAVDSSAPPPDAPGERIIDYYTGEIGKKVLDKFRTSVETGKFGAALTLLSPGGAAAATDTPAVSAPMPQRDPLVDPLVSPATTSTTTTSKPEEGKLSPLMPGVVFIGQGKQRDLLAKARQEGLELLLILDVVIDTTKTQTINNTKLLLIPLADERTPVYASRPINALRVEALRKDPRNREPDAVDESITRMFDAIEKKGYFMSPLPAALNAQNVANRVTKLADSKPNDVLETLLEISLYGYKQWVTPEQAKPAFEKLIGAVEAAKLLGPPADRREALSKLLPKVDLAAPVAASDSQPTEVQTPLSPGQ